MSSAVSGSLAVMAALKTGCAANLDLTENAGILTDSTLPARPRQPFSTHEKSHHLRHLRPAAPGAHQPVETGEGHGRLPVVGLSSDEFNAIKNKKAFYSYEERKLVLEAVRYVDVVIPEHTWEQKEQDIVRS